MELGPEDASLSKWVKHVWALVTAVIPEFRTCTTHSRGDGRGEEEAAAPKEEGKASRDLPSKLEMGRQCGPNTEI